MPSTVFPRNLILIVLLALHGATSSAVSGPAAASVWGDRFVETLRMDDEAGQREIISGIYTPGSLQSPGVDRLLAFHQKMRREYAPFDYHHSEVVSTEMGSGVISHVLHVYLRPKGQAMWRDFQFHLDSSPPHRISRIAFIAEVSEPVSLPNGDIADASTRAWLDRYIDKLSAETGLSGSLLIAQGATVLHERHFGFADAARARPVDAQTLFNLGSGNKMFTAVVIARLAEQGRLQLTDPLTRHLPELFPDGLGARVTLAQLLSHTSGLREYWTKENEPEMARARGWRDLLPLVQRAGFGAAPGAQAGYSNSNFIVLGAVIEKVTGRDYFEVVHDLVYRPAGMMHAGSHLVEGTDLPLATPLARDGESGWKPAPRPKRGSPAGGGYATAADMLRFARALREGRIIRPETLQQLTRNATQGLPDAFPYGLGFIPEVHGRMSSYGHGGIAPGVNFEFRHFPGPDLTLIVFSNQDNGAYDDLRRNVTKLITGQR